MSLALPAIEVKRNPAFASAIEDVVRILAYDHDARRLEFGNSTDEAAPETFTVVTVLHTADFANGDKAALWYACEEVVAAESGAADVAKRVEPETLQPCADELIAVDVVATYGIPNSGPVLKSGAMKPANLLSFVRYVQGLFQNRSIWSSFS